VKRPNCPSAATGRLRAAASSMGSASAGEGYCVDHTCPGGSGERYRTPPVRIHIEPGLKRKRRAWARQVTKGWAEVQLTQGTNRLGSVAARPASSLTMSSAFRYFPPERTTITPGATPGAKV